MMTNLNQEDMNTNRAIEAVLETLSLDEEDRSFVHQIMGTAARMAEDNLGSLELKMLTNAMQEIRHAFRVFRNYDDRKKISVFGSARTRPDEPNYRAAERFARGAADRGYMVISGAGPGIMEAANKGAGRENSFGLHITIPHEYEPNQYIQGDDKCIHFRYFFSRKLIFSKESEAIVYFPGGFGTHDELFELLCLMQTGRHHLAPLVLVDREGYWENIMEYLRDPMLRAGTIGESDLELIDYVTTPDRALDVVDRFYSNYHSSRFLEEDYLIRFRTYPGEDALEELENQFSDLCPESGFRVQRGPLDGEEQSAPEDLYRLVFYLTNHDYGRLRQLVGHLNGWADSGGTSL